MFVRFKIILIRIEMKKTISFLLFFFYYFGNPIGAFYFGGKQLHLRPGNQNIFTSYDYYYELLWYKKFKITIILILIIVAAHACVVYY